MEPVFGQPCGVWCIYFMAVLPNYWSAGKKEFQIFSTSRTFYLGLKQQCQFVSAILDSPFFKIASTSSYAPEEVDPESVCYKTRPGLIVGLLPHRLNVSLKSNEILCLFGQVGVVV